MYIQKTWRLGKSKSICVTFFIYKKLDTLPYAIFHQSFEIGGRGEHFYKQKTMYFPLNFYMQKIMHFPLCLYILKTDTLRHILNAKKFTLRCVFIFKIYCIAYSDT